MMRRLTVTASRSALAGARQRLNTPFFLNPTLACISQNQLATRILSRCMCASASPDTQKVRMPDMSKEQEVVDFEADLIRQLDTYSAEKINGLQLVALIQDLPMLVSHMESPDDPITCDIILRTAQLLAAYRNNFEVHLPATFVALTTLKSDISPVRALVAAVAQKVAELDRPFTDAESWTAVKSLRDLSSSHAETLALVAAIAKKMPVENTKIEFSPVDTVLTSLRGLGGLDSDYVEVQELVRAINFRLRCKKGKVDLFSSFQDAVLGVRNKSSDRPEVRELLRHLVDIKYRWDAFRPHVVTANEPEEEDDEDVRLKRNPARFRLERLDFKHGQEVVDFIRVLGRKTHLYSQFHAMYKKCDRKESPYLEVISFLDLPVLSLKFLKDHKQYVAAHHEAGHILASRLLPHAATSATISKFVSHTAFRPHDVTTTDHDEERFLDKQAISMAGVAAEYLILGAVAPSADFRSVIDAAEEQLQSDGSFVHAEGNTLRSFLKQLQSLLWAVSSSISRGGESDWVQEHVLRLIDTQFFRVLQLLAEHEGRVRALAELLLANKSLSEEEICRILEEEEEEKEEEGSASAGTATTCTTDKLN